MAQLGPQKESLLLQNQRSRAAEAGGQTPSFLISDISPRPMSPAAAERNQPARNTAKVIIVKSGGPIIPDYDSTKV